MKISDIKIRRTYRESRLRALVSLIIDDSFAVHDIKIIDGPNRFFVAMPSRRDEQGMFRDVCHPVTPAARQEIEEQVLRAYRAFLDAQENPDAATSEPK
jgi:stage V sporulation protein G